MVRVNIQQAKSRLSDLLARVEHGEDVVIARGNRPIARLVPATGEAAAPRKPGTARGLLVVPDDFDAPTPHAALDRAHRKC